MLCAYKGAMFTIATQPKNLVGDVVCEEVNALRVCFGTGAVSKRSTWVTTDPIEVAAVC
eukprot:s1043_g23.t1